ncbi:MAG: hypothetical protein OXF79_30940 [Chloroflexi bacterium]|nr:hypothetical protein [Chloroflexota bacterium]
MTEKIDYEAAVYRLDDAHQIVNRLWQNAPDVERSCTPVYDAVQAWPWVSNGYQLIEQPLKLLLAVRQDIPLDDLEPPKLRKSHHLDQLFGVQEKDDQAEVSRVYKSFIDLHGYIDIPTVTQFLGSVGRGYVKWRYMLLEGAQGIPTNHVGALLEIAAVTISRLKFHVLGRPAGFPAVTQRISHSLDDTIGHVCNRLMSGDDRQGWQNRYDRLHQLLRDSDYRRAIAFHLENTDNPRLGPQAPPNPHAQPVAPLAPDIEAVVGALKRSRDRKNYVVYFRRSEQ